MATKPHDEAPAAHGAAGPGYAGFGGSAGYSGSGAGGISGGYAGGGYSDGPWRPVPNTQHDDRIQADLKERLDQATELDATEIEVLVEAGEVTLEGRIPTRAMKHAATEIAERVPGVERVHNRLHVEQALLDELREKLSLGR
jgi:hypothetical protein